MECHELEANLTEFLEGELNPQEEQAAIEHLATCQHCETILAETKAVVATTAEHGGEKLDPEARERVFQSILDSSDY